MISSWGYISAPQELLTQQPLGGEGQGVDSLLIWERRRDFPGAKPDKKTKFQKYGLAIGVEEQREISYKGRPELGPGWVAAQESLPRAEAHM